MERHVENSGLKGLVTGLHLPRQLLGTFHAAPRLEVIKEFIDLFTHNAFQPVLTVSPRK